MKTTFTYFFRLIMAGFLATLLLPAVVMAAEKDDEPNPNFRYIDDFELGVSLWWTPDGSGSTIGIVLDGTYREHETTIVNPHTGSTGSMKLAYQWNNEVTFVGPGTHLIRQHMPAGNANTPERVFQPDQAIEAWVYGDGSGNLFRFMTREVPPSNQLEGSQWFVIDWTGWRRITWDLSNDPVIGWVNGNGQFEGGNIMFDSFMISWSGDASSVSGTVYFDDLRIVDPFDVVFDVTAGGNPINDAVVAINGTVYEPGEYAFSMFPGEFSYTVTKEGYMTAFGNFDVDDQNLSIPVVMTTGEDPAYTVTFSVFDSQENLIDDAVIAIDGTEFAPGHYTFELGPGFYQYVVSKPGYYNAEGLLTVTNSNLFVNVILQEDAEIYNNIYLSWDVAATATNAVYRDEYYSVWARFVDPEEEDEPEFDPEDWFMIFDETLDPDIPAWTYQPREIEISVFSGEHLRFAFRHHESTDKDRIVIDNVKIEAIRIGDVPGILLNEDFSGGITDPIDEDFLPEGWEAIDLDEDGFNWYFQVREGQGAMRSQSYDSGEGALTPDNWLLTPVIEMPQVMFFQVNFQVKDQDDQTVEGAVVTIDGEEFDPGDYQFFMTSGTYEFEVTKDGYQGAEGIFTVSTGNITVPVVLTQLRYDVLFRVTMIEAEGFVPGETPVYITGNLPQLNWAVPGSDEENQRMESTENIYIFTKEFELPAGTYEYKYFDGPSWAHGEWEGGDNRIITVEGPMEVLNVFGSPTDEVSTNDLMPFELKMYPNPAVSHIQLESAMSIDRIEIFSLTGQLVIQAEPAAAYHQIDVSSMRAGIYLIRIQSGTEVISRKLQINR